MINKIEPTEIVINSIRRAASKHGCAGLVKAIGGGWSPITALSMGQAVNKDSYERVCSWLSAQGYPVRATGNVLYLKDDAHVDIRLVRVNSSQWYYTCHLDDTEVYRSSNLENTAEAACEDAAVWASNHVR